MFTFAKSGRKHRISIDFFFQISHENNDTKKKMASETVTDGCEERRYFETQERVKQR